MSNPVFAPRLITLCLVLASAIFQAVPSLAQSEGKDSKETPEWISIGIKEEIESEILGETRKISVSTPPGYDGKEKKFVTIYVLDGPKHFVHTTGLVDFLFNRGLMPPAIVVGVDTQNAARTRDLTPKADNPMRSLAERHGGAEKFVAFLRDELIPHIEDKYPVHSHRTLIGKSLGGLFALHTLVHHGDTFDAYVAISPSLQWDDQKLVMQSEKFFKDAGELNKSLYVAVGNEGGAVGGGVLKMAGILSEHRPKGFDWKHRIMPEETHGSVAYRSTRQGLEFIFSDWALKDPLPLYDQGGMAAIQQYYKDSSTKFGVQRPFGLNEIFGVLMGLDMAKRFDESVQLVREDSQKEKPFIPWPFYPFVANNFEDANQPSAAKEIYRLMLKAKPGNQKAREALVRLGVPESELPKVEEQRDAEKKTENVEAKDTHADEEGSLKVNEARSSKLTLKTADEYTVNVKKNTFVFGAVNQMSVDVVVSVHDTDGKKLAEFDEPSRGPEYFHFESDKAGLYKIKVAPFEEETGDYEISLSRVEPIAKKPEDRVDQLMSQYDNKTTPGGVVAVIKGGEVAFSKAYGMANLTYEVPFEVDTRTNIGSTSKQFTAYAILLLAQQNKLSLDDDFRKHIPELPDLGETVTLRHALTHTTGYREFLNTIAMTGRRLDRGDWIDRDEIIKIVQRQPELQNSPGAEFNYNNTGFALLAEVVARVGKKSFPQWMSENVFQPLEMSNTFVRANPRTIVERASMGYAPDKNGNYRESPDLGAARGAGSIYTTIGDLAKWIKNYRTGELGGSEIFKQVSTPNKLTDGKATEYGFGLFIDQFEGQRRIHHGGADTAHRSMVMFFPELDAAVITQSNNAAFDSSISVSVARVFFEEDLGKKEDVKSEEALTQEKAVASQEAEVATIEGEAFDKFAGRFELEEMAGVVFTFFREGDKFFAQPTGRPKREITPTGPTSFKVNGIEAEFVFHPDEKGEMNMLTFKQNGAQKGKRIPADPWSPDAEKLDAYDGRYFSDELETFYRIVIIDDKLVLKVRRMEDAALSPTSENLFLSEQGTELQFQEQEDGKFMKLLVSNGRTRGVLFSRADSGDAKKPKE